MNNFIVSAIIYSEERKSVLMQHRDEHAPYNGKWGLFGGHNEEGEEPIEALIRELYEELGVRVSASHVEFLFAIKRPEKPDYHIFLTKNNQEKSDFVLGEGQGFDWVPIQHVLSYYLTDGGRIAIRKFIDEYL